MKSRFNVFLTAAILSTTASGLVMAAVDAPAAAQAGAAASSTSAVKLTAGEVRKVDAEQGKLTIKHGPLDNLDMPAMTMVFKASKPELIKDVKAGDKIRFRAEKIDGAFLVTQVESAK